MNRPRAPIFSTALTGALLAAASHGLAAEPTSPNPPPEPNPLQAPLLSATADQPLPAPETEGESIDIQPLQADSRLDYDVPTGTVSATNGVQVMFRDATLTARQVRLDPALGEAEAEGAVNLDRGGQIWTGESLRYNFKTGRLEAREFKLGVPPVFVGGERAITLEAEGTNRVLTLTNSFVTTDDLATPGYRIRARSMTIREDRHIIARDAVLYVGRTPVFYFPYYVKQLKSHPYRWVLTPGFRSLYGGYMRAALEMDVTTNVVAAVHADPYTRRGVGLGPEVRYDLDQAGRGHFDSYWIADQRPENDPVTGQPIEPQRERIYFDHRISLREDLTATAVLRQQSDAWVVRDFFEQEYRRNPLPGSFVEVQQAWPDFTLDLLARAQVNDFFETVERLPDVKLSAHRQQLGTSPIYYDGENSAGWFQHRFAEGSITNDYSAFRGDTFHQLLLPKTLFGWLNVTPRVAGRVTYYGDTQSQGWTNLKPQTRAVFNTGAEFSFKASRVWKGSSSQFWDVDGLRHILEPSVNYSFTPEPNARPLELPQFDTELPSLRLLPLTYPDFNSIDSIDTQNAMRLGVRNKIQTKRGGKVEDLIDWAVLTDWRLDRQPNQGSFSDIYSEADFKPRRWLTMNSEIRADPEAGLLRETQTSAIFKPNSDWSFGVTHRYTRDDQALGRGGNLIGTRLYLRFSENWGFRTSHFYEVRDRLLQEQFYTVYRDLRSLTAALTLRWRESIAESQDITDITVALAVSLKAYPRFKQGQDAERPELLIGQ
jgi:lipopolysaccharide assembly outer membrane protein LptD (OstA)